MTGLVTDYIRYLLIALIMGLSVPLWHFFEGIDFADIAALQLDMVPPEYYEIGLAALMAFAGVMSCTVYSRIVLVLSLSLVGALMSIFFVLFSAPDVALTQILVDAVSLVLFLLVLRYFSVIVPRPTPLGTQVLNIGISVGTGLLVVLLLCAANMGPSLPSLIAPYYLSNSYALAGGQNVVNVILVDFRGFDTMGEITVFSVAVFAVFAMVRLGEKGARPFGAILVWFPSPILQSFARLTLHLMLVFAIYLLLRGHNAPGGGFIAGVLTAAAITFQMMAFNLEAVVDEMPWDPLRMVILGLLLAAFTGLGALAFGHPFLTSAIGHFVLPLLGEVELVTAIGFDIGVYLVVLGTTVGIIRTIAED
jgi:multisubunit Na+/H+ antiporter MnhB subunit